LICLLLYAAVMPTVVFAGTSGPSPVPAPPGFQIVASSLTLCRGVVNYIPITVTNPGSQPMTSLQLGIVASKNIYAIGNGTINQATVPANSSVVVRLPIFASLNTSNLVSAGISVNYNYLSLYSDSETRNVSFVVQTCPTALSVNLNSIVAVSGRSSNITINLTNMGKVPLSAISIRASLPSQDGAILTAQPTLIGSLNPKASAIVNENVFIFRNASQSFPINVSASFYNGTNPVQILDTIQMLSSGIINITPSSITLSPQNPRAGSIFSASFILTDTGTSGASAVTATAIPPAGFSAYGSSSVFVGDMQVDTQTPVTLTLLAGSGVKSGNYTIAVRISYLNGLRQNQTTTISVPVRISGAAFNSSAAGAGGGTQAAQAGSDFLSLVMFLIIIVLAVLLYRERKRGRKTK
jgi:hypothetical protein